MAIAGGEDEWDEKPDRRSKIGVRIIEQKVFASSRKEEGSRVLRRPYLSRQP